MIPLHDVTLKNRLSNDREWSKIKVSFSLNTFRVNSHAIFMKICQHYFLVINFIPVYSQNCVACQMVSLLKYTL